jgi:hypothetical protein
LFPDSHGTHLTPCFKIHLKSSQCLPPAITLRGRYSPLEIILEQHLLGDHGDFGLQMLGQQLDFSSVFVRNKPFPSDVAEKLSKPTVKLDLILTKPSTLLTQRS